MLHKVKICGLTKPDMARVAVAAGADYLGFIHFAKSPRHLDLASMAALIAEVRADGSGVKCVSVVVNPDDDLIDAIARDVRPDLIQLHGHESVDRTCEIAARSGLPLIKAISVENAADIEGAMAYEPHVAHLMFDAKPPEDAALPGGMGLSFDWSLLAGLETAKPWFLAGGLRPDNVAAALKATNAPMVDVSSGVETAPGLKDASLIRAFIHAAKGV
jgi:phosphoribosylanthranilate isomerase